MEGIFKMSNQANSLFSVIDFVNQAKTMFDFSKGRDIAFVQYMKQKNHFYMYSAKDFIPYAQKYFKK